MSAHGVFVTGTDTGVGKTYVACALLRAFAARGRSVVGMKPVVTGASRDGPGAIARWDDVDALAAASSVQAPVSLVSPYAFEPPLAPHIAAARAGTSIELARLAAAFCTLSAMAELTVVEGIGGFRVPLNAEEDTADLASLLGLPVILVVGLRLGCLSHALLTAEAVTAQGLRLAGWVANSLDPHMAALEDNVGALEARLPAPMLGVLPYAPGDAGAAAAILACGRHFDCLIR
ncbi:MAG: dethiobiotin synthase [Betaproteobacteria bacterium]|nr:dethiobiotin synthase [Betaproteobacteria bacterium]